MAISLNVHGDQMVPTTGLHGADIASQRLDELDKRAIRYLLDFEAPHPVCLDVGCGLGWQGARFATMGAEAHFYDLIPASGLITTLQEHGLRITYVRGDLRLPIRDFPADVALAFSQRFVHYLRYTEAKTLIAAIGSHMLADALFFVSASGIDSELGDKYRGKGVNIKDRFAPLSLSNQKKHGIFEDVCLYNEKELEQLMLSCGFRTQTVWRSTFGNIKGVFSRSS